MLTELNKKRILDETLNRPLNRLEHQKLAQMLARVSSEITFSIRPEAEAPFLVNCRLFDQTYQDIKDAYAHTFIK